MSMLALACEMTKKSDHRTYHHGVVIVRGGKVVAKGYNKGVQHAEINALKRIWPSERKGCKVWSVRVTPGGRLGSGKPCARCEQYLREQGVKTVYYSTGEGTIEKMRLRLDF